MFNFWLVFNHLLSILFFNELIKLYKYSLIIKFIIMLYSNFFEKSFNFDITLTNKKTFILRNNSTFFNKLPIEIIQKIFKMLAFISEGYYYYVRDLSIYPNIINRYIGKCCAIKNNYAKISYNGWNDSFDEWVPVKNISYLDKTQMPVYKRGEYLDILDTFTCEWYKGIICGIESTNNQFFLTVIYRVKLQKKFILVMNIPIYYKFIAPYKRHTFRVWNNGISNRFFNFYRQRNYQDLIQYIKDKITYLGYKLHLREIINKSFIKK